MGGGGYTHCVRVGMKGETVYYDNVGIHTRGFNFKVAALVVHGSQCVSIYVYLELFALLSTLYAIVGWISP